MSGLRWHEAAEAQTRRQELMFREGVFALRCNASSSEPSFKQKQSFSAMDFLAKFHAKQLCRQDQPRDSVQEHAIAL